LEEKRRKEMIYQWGAIKYKVDAQVAGEEVARIASVRPLTAEAIVDESKAEDAPLNPIFEWDNEKASHEWRKQQARVMLANLVTVQIGITPIEATRAYVNVTRSDGEYTGIDVVVKSTTLSERLIQQAISELNAYRKKYANVLELKRHFGWLNEFENEVLKEVEK
jgi:hypothetical protein